MDYSLLPDKKNVKCIMKGEFTFSDHPTFRSMIDEAVKTGAHTIQVDLANVDYVDSAGLGMFLVAQERAQSEDWTLRISNPKERVKTMFKLVKLETLIQVINE
ncbi:STAS domain-containing protein [Kiloniella laminariae]|uniref:STAS domain-containing protein n=1 Tax=Kiloniella laminariae TaxID=454162 RepID=A0ABT4LN23_9PROT|nr:STAS domain-containing protein [Kiloniella laminariae]MCZ4282285.1 STAS domain-containing protein [Kiloniella laminariae]